MRPKLEEMTLREKIGQTGMPSPNDLREGVIECGSYAAYYSRPAEMGTLFNSLSYGATKSVCVSFGAPSIYYNYFECADAFINAYSDDKGTLTAFVDGILGDFPFVGKSPVPLRPVFAED